MVNRPPLDSSVVASKALTIIGPTFRHRPDGIIINTPTGLRAIYETKANVKKGRYYEVYPRKTGENNTLNVIDKAKHTRKRRILSPAFSDKAIRSAEDFIIQNADRWCEILVQGTHGDWSKPINMAECVDRYVFDILGDLCFGKDFETKEPKENQFKVIPKLITTYVKFIHPVG